MSAARVVGCAASVDSGAAARTVMTGKANQLKRRWRMTTTSAADFSRTFDPPRLATAAGIGAQNFSATGCVTKARRSITVAVLKSRVEVPERALTALRTWYVTLN